MKFIVVLFLAALPFSVFSQDSIIKQEKKITYLPIHVYKIMGYQLTKSDTLNFKFHNNDTLVRMPDGYVHQQSDNKVRVEYERRDEAFLNYYKDVVFKNENSTLKIWKEDLKLYFDPSVPLKHQEALMDFANGLSTAVDSLNIVEVNSREESNFLVYYTGKEGQVEYEPKMTKEFSQYWLYWNKQQQLTQGFIKIDTRIVKKPVYQIANLKFHFLRSLGFFGESAFFEKESYFSNKNGIRSLTNLDMEILKYHYSYGVCKGINKKRFEEFHREIEELLQKLLNSKVMVTHEI